MVVNCICNAESLQSETKNNIDENDQSNLSHFETIVKTFMENWIDFNYEVICCYNLVMNGKILKKYCIFLMASILVLQIKF